jgi:hypothetical protein
MKKLFKNFEWSAFFAYGIIFSVVSTIGSWLFGEFKELGFGTGKFLLVLLFKALFFGLFMSLLFGKKVLNKKEHEN